MKKILEKLLTVKSIITILVTLVFCYLAIIGGIAAAQFMTIFTVIVSFYFGTQHQKNEGTVNSNENNTNTTNNIKTE